MKVRVTIEMDVKDCRVGKHSKGGLSDIIINAFGRILYPFQPVITSSPDCICLNNFEVIDIEEDENA